MSKQKLSIGIVFLTEILVLGVLLAMIFKGSRTVQVLSPSVAEWESRYTSFDGNAWNGTPEMITEDLPEKDDLALIYGPFLPLPRGMYDVCVEYTCDTDQTVSIYSAENSDRIHLLGTDSLPAKKQVCTYHFYTTRDIPDLEVRMKYNGIGNLSIRNILITTSVFFYKPAFIFLAAVFVLTDLLIFKRKSKSSGKAVELMRFRSIWMAFAMLYVMLYHSGIRFDRHVVDAVLDSGYGGVDIFFFATGIGCYLSYIKDSDAGAFLKRRMLRLLPAYFCFMIPWCAYKIIVDHMPLSSLIGNLFSIEGIKGTGFAFNWYVSAVWIFYILTPFLATFICKRITSFYRCLLLIGAALLLSAAFWDYSVWIIIVTRLPVMILGMYAAKRYTEKTLTFCLSDHILLGICSVCGIGLLVFFNRFYPDLMWGKGLYWYPFLLIVPGVCDLLSYLAGLLAGSGMGKQILRPLEWFGSTTWELYLAHIALFRLYDSLCEKDVLPKSNIYRLLTLAVAVAVAALLKFAAKNVSRLVIKVVNKSGI